MGNERRRGDYLTIMTREENNCVGCPDGLPCIGNNCPMRNVPHTYCDNCGEEIDPDYAIKDGEMEYCDDCAEELGLLEEEETVNE